MTYEQLKKIVDAMTADDLNRVVWMTDPDGGFCEADIEMSLVSGEYRIVPMFENDAEQGLT